MKRGDKNKLKYETHHKHIFMGSGKFDNKHGVGIMLNKRWRQRIIDTEYINERAITTTILVNRQHVKLMSVYFLHSKCADYHIEKMCKTIEKHMAHCDKHIPIIGEDINAELGPGKETERKNVGRYTLNEGNKSGDSLESWLMLQDYTALNTKFRKTPQKQTTFISPKGNEKQIDYTLTKRRHLKDIKDAEASDMIHRGSDHRCVMATVTISMLGKNSNHKGRKGKHDMVKRERSTQAAKSISIEMPQLEKNQEIVETKKIQPQTLEEAEAQEIERGSMKSSSTVSNQRGVPALSEHRRQDRWTSTSCACDNTTEGRGYDEMAGERLPKQRPHSIEKMKQEHKKSKEEARRAAV